MHKKLLERTKEGRNINRHYYTKEEVEQNFTRPVVKKLRSLMQFRNQCEAFDGECICSSTDDQLRIERVGKETKAVLTANLISYAFTIEVEDVSTHETRQINIREKE